jgi:hypothetical protein
MAHRVCERALAKENPRDNCRRQAATFTSLPNDL